MEIIRCHELFLRNIRKFEREGSCVLWPFSLHIHIPFFLPPRWLACRGHSYAGGGAYTYLRLMAFFLLFFMEWISWGV